MSEEFKCRTKEISGITYRVFIYDSNSIVARSSYQSKQAAQNRIDTMNKVSPKYRGEITEIPWTKTVCIECGQEGNDY